MADVTFLGLGTMGFALANAAVKSGLDTVVWNRTTEKAIPLQKQGAVVAADPREAIQESPIVVVCVYDYEVANEILMQDDCASALSGRVLVQLSTGTPRTAMATYTWAGSKKILYLDGEFLAYPSDTGSDAARIVVAGDETAFTTAVSLLKILSPRTEYLGSDPAKSSALNFAILSSALGLILGTINGAAICEAAGIPLKLYSESLPSSAMQDGEALVESLKKIETGGLENTEAYIEGWAEIPTYMANFAKDTGYSPEVSKFIRQFFDKAIEHGYGAHDVGALINVLRPKGRP